MTGRQGDIRGLQAQPAQEDINVGYSFTFTWASSLSPTLSSPRSPFPSYTKAEAECKLRPCTVTVRLHNKVHLVTLSLLKDSGYI